MRTRASGKRSAAERAMRTMQAVVTPDELRGIETFSSLDEATLARLAAVAADITLVPGEFAVHQGDERALLAVLEGRLETIQVVDGVEHVRGKREAGDLIGEVPLTLGTVYPAGFRASEPSRVLRVDLKDYYAAAAQAPELAAGIGRLAAYRMSGPSGLLAIASDRPASRAIVLCPRWSDAGAQLRRFLDRNQVSHTWVLSDAADAEALWGGPLPADEDCPAIRLVESGKVIVRPQLRRVAELLGLATEPRETDYDVLIVGGGPAGLAAAVYGASEGLRTIVIEREAPGGQAGTSSRIENYLGFPGGVSGDELAGRALQQAQRLGAEIVVTREITRIDAVNHHVYLDGGDILRAATIILACGVSWRRLGIDGFDRLVGKGISYGAARSEAPQVHGLDVHIIGAGNSAGQAALHFSQHARRVTILCRGADLNKSMSHYLIEQLARRLNIDVKFDSEVVAAHGEAALEAIDVHDRRTGETTTEASDGVYIFIGADAETAWLPSEIALDERGFVLTGPDVSSELDRDPYLLETSVPGVFACGDVRSGPVKRVAAAVGEGSMAIAFVHQYLRERETEPLRG
jgi:thioredoxin reductase (NADPH)